MMFMWFVFHALARRKMVADQAGADSNLVGADRRADALPQTAMPRSTLPPDTVERSGVTKSG